MLSGDSALLSRLFRGFSGRVDSFLAQDFYLVYIKNPDGSGNYNGFCVIRSDPFTKSPAAVISCIINLVTRTYCFHARCHPIDDVGIPDDCVKIGFYSLAEKLNF
jgi:hypothetical protein